MCVFVFLRVSFFLAGTNCTQISMSIPMSVQVVKDPREFVAGVRAELSALKKRGEKVRVLRMPPSPCAELFVNTICRYCLVCSYLTSRRRWRSFPRSALCLTWLSLA